MLQHIDENRSLWTAEKPEDTPCPPLRADCAADVAIVGGGFTGISTAWHLARRFPERRIVLLESRTLGTGASGRNGGQVLNWINGIDSPDAEHARRIYDLTSEGIDLIASIIEEHRLDVPFRRGGCLEVFTDARRAEEAAAWVEEARGAHIPLELLHGDRLRRRLDIDTARAAILDPRAGRIDGVALVRAMRPVLCELGVAIHEGTPVLGVEEGARIRIRTPAAEVRARAMVLATGAYTPHLGYFKDAIFPLQSHVVATEPRSAAEWASMGWGDALAFSDDLDRITYATMTPRGALLLGGGNNAAYGYLYGGATAYTREPIAGYRAGEQQLRRLFPRAQAVRIAHRWTGAEAATVSRLCAIGACGEHHNVYYAFGYSGHGITMAHLAGRILCDLYSGDDARWRAFPFYQPHLWRMPREPLRWLGYQLYTRLTGRSPRKPYARRS